MDGLARIVPLGRESDADDGISPIEPSEAIRVGLIDPLALTRDCLALAFASAFPGVVLNIRNIMRKMGATNRTEAVYKAQQFRRDAGIKLWLWISHRPRSLHPPRMRLAPRAWQRPG